MLRRWPFVLWVILAGGLAPVASWSASAVDAHGAVAEDPQALLVEADRLKTIDHPRFVEILQRLDAMQPGLSLKQRWYLKYLDGWQADYSGNVNQALLMLRDVMQQNVDLALRFRAMATSVNALDMSHRYSEAFVLLNRMLDLAPKVSDSGVRFQGFGEAAQLLIGAGHFELAASYAGLMLANIPPGETACKPLTLKALAAYKGGELDNLAALQQKAIDACATNGDSIFANNVRADMAEIAIRHNDPDKALALLRANFPDVERTKFKRQLAQFSALMAQAYWRKHDWPDAEHWALKTVDLAAGAGYDVPLATAYRVLYQLDSRRDDYKAAMGWLLEYTDANKDYLDDVHARALAYETVRQQAKAEQMRLEMQAALDRKAMETSRLYIALLLVVLAFVAFWLYRLKRSQLRFKFLAQRDGLTGILNHQFFVQRAEEALLRCSRLGQPAGLIVLDLDHFKLINDTHGHAVGDEMLKQAVMRSRSCLHPGDVFGRLGGEEFAVLLAGHTLMQSLLRAEAIRRAIAAVPQSEASVGIEMTASLGVADTEESGYELRQLLVDADLALYRAKREGRNRVVARAG